MSYPERDHPLRGLRVVVYLDDADCATMEGILVGVALDGEVAVRGDDGVTRYGWPCLDIRAAERAPVWRRDWEPPWPDSRWPDDADADHEPARPTDTIWLPGDGP